MKLFLRYIRLMIGLAVCAVGVVFTIEADIGLSPWDIFHQGLGRHIGMTIGQAGIIVGFVVLAVDWLLGERFGMGTILNIIVVSLLLDWIMAIGIIPTAHTMWLAIAYVALGMFLVGVGSVLYIGAGLGAGPRDAIMVALVRHTGKSVRLIRTLLEGSVFAAGALLGGKIGIGSVIMAGLFGFFVQLAFRICRFEVKDIHHRTIDEEIAGIKHYALARRVRQH